MSRIKNNRTGFTLIELLLVLLLTVILYGFFAQNFTIGKVEENNIKLEKLNRYLFENFAKNSEHISLKCINNCNECRVIVDN